MARRIMEDLIREFRQPPSRTGLSPHHHERYRQMDEVEYSIRAPRGMRLRMLKLLDAPSESPEDSGDGR